jgi:hypothetical protein
MNRLLLTIALVIVAAVPAGLEAAAPVQADEALVKLAKRAKLAVDGKSAQLKVRVQCPSGWETLEGFVYISQNGSTSNNGALNPVCDNQIHTYFVWVTNMPDNPLFVEGQANASAYLLLIHPDTQETLSGQATRAIKLKSKIWQNW